MPVLAVTSIQQFENRVRGRLDLPFVLYMAATTIVSDQALLGLPSAARMCALFAFVVSLNAALRINRNHIDRQLDGITLSAISGACIGLVASEVLDRVHASFSA